MKRIFESFAAPIVLAASVLLTAAGAQASPGEDPPKSWRSASQTLSRALAPEWLVHPVGHPACSGTLIGARVVLVPQVCAWGEDRHQVAHSVRFFNNNFEASAKAIVIRGPREHFSVMLLDQDSGRRAAPLPSYWRASQLQEQLGSMTLFGIPPAFTGNVVKRSFEAGIPAVSDIRVPPWTHGSSPVYFRGMGIFQEDDGVEWFMGMVAHHRVSREHPGVSLDGADRSLYRQLLKSGARNDALAFAMKRLNPYERAAMDWGTDEERHRAALSPETFELGAFGNRGTIGSIYPRFNKARELFEFFRLVATDPQHRYGPLPSGSQDNAQWEFLGTDLPDRASASASFKSWAMDRAGGKVGEIFARWNERQHKIEYFELKQVNEQGLYEDIPADAPDSRHWAYRGADLPVSRQVKGVDCGGRTGQ
ncbi:hypothetical protein ABE85_25105 [Mitsuaria sp. 7]|nr:hypothetical protein ABE85_25105 [Mitsuaria sp. 7]